MTDTNLNSKPAVVTAPAVSTDASAVVPKVVPTGTASATQKVGEPAKSTAPVAPAAATAPVPPIKTPGTYQSKDFGGAPIVKLCLRQEGIIQYDPVYRLKLTSTTPVDFPLTPFFAARLNSTVKLCE
jgi:hypothetical protein